MTYNEFKQYCSIKFYPNGERRYLVQLENELSTIGYFLTLLNGCKDIKKGTLELLEMINHLELKSGKDIIIKKKNFEFHLSEEKKQEEMILLASKIRRNKNGDLIINKEDYIYELRLNIRSSYMPIREAVHS